MFIAKHLLTTMIISLGHIPNCRIIASWYMQYIQHLALTVNRSKKKMDVAIYSLNKYENAYILNKTEYCKQTFVYLIGNF